MNEDFIKIWNCSYVGFENYIKYFFISLAINCDHLKHFWNSEQVLIADCFSQIVNL